MMTDARVKVAILEDHQSIVDGYLYRLEDEPKIEVVATVYLWEELEAVLEQHPVDVLLLGVQVPTSVSNSNPHPVLHSVSDLLHRHPNVSILAISTQTRAVLVQALVDAGVSGYIYMDDHEAIKNLAKIILMTAVGGGYFSQAAYRQLHQKVSGLDSSILSPRQIEVLSLCASYPDESTEKLAERLNVAGSTVRNLLSTAYVRLGVHTRAGAIAKMKTMGLFPDSPGPE